MTTIIRIEGDESDLELLRIALVERGPNDIEPIPEQKTIPTELGAPVLQALIVSATAPTSIVALSKVARTWIEESHKSRRFKWLLSASGEDLKESSLDQIEIFGRELEESTRLAQKTSTKANKARSKAKTKSRRR